LDDCLPEAYALVREVSARVLNMRHFDVQMLAGIALHHGKLVEMQTGEGKTLAAVLPAFLNALSGQGVHILTFNDYLAGRDADWMRPIYEFLGLSVSSIKQGMSKEARRDAYAADITYLTVKEAGYDFLRESIVLNAKELILRPYNMVIVDEADSILIDEARTPLVIAGLDPAAREIKRSQLAELTKTLTPLDDYQTDEHKRNVYLTEEGINKVETSLRIGKLHAPDNHEILTRLNQALHAEVLLKIDVDYVVRQEQVEIVDEFTGRVILDRHWPDGLHRAVEAKEGLPLKAQGQILNSIAIQHFIKQYPKICGMTGTAIPADREFFEFYDLTTVPIPTNKPNIRNDFPDRIFDSLEAKHQAVVEEVAQAQDRQQPVLIGTSSVFESKTLAEKIRSQGIDCQVLNAVNDQAEAEIIKNAGAEGAVTVSTNMAGRGTDIKLGGAQAHKEKYEQVLAAGGLYVIGTNRHESRRIDDQLRGRAGRQGDRGCSRFFVSLEDPLMQRFSLDKYFKLGSNKIAFAQRAIEGQNLDIRRTLWNYSSFIDEKRKLLFDMRSKILLGETDSRLEDLEKYQKLRKKVDQAVLDKVERQISLYHIDQAWIEYLAQIADIREAIYLNVVGGREPLAEFLRQAAKLYFQMLQSIDENIVQTFEKAAIGPKGIDLEREGLKGPTSTWTYLINDNPFDWLSATTIRNIGSGAWTGVLIALFWFVPVFYKLIRSIRGLFGKSKGLGG
jgi:preprotein translocase subunit SecA